jgi:hypothetical protein
VSLVRITVVTFRRAHLLKRALDSVRAQTHRHWIAEVVNDDAEDPEPSRLIAAIGDPRITILNQAERAGGAANFNYAFRHGPEPYAALLEDDNWWEPAFLETMVEALDARPDAALITGNERIWQEQSDGQWVDTGRTLRPVRDRVRNQPLRALDKCGAAILCNSAVVWRPAAIPEFATPPSMPVDVTEHYRERLIPHPFLLHDLPLANFAVTLTTNRSGKGEDWTVQQLLLTASVFASLPPSRRPRLAEALWHRTRTGDPVARTMLLLAGWIFPEAHSLWRSGTIAEKGRLAAHLLRRPAAFARFRRIRDDHADQWSFLCSGTVADALGRGQDGLD